MKKLLNTIAAMFLFLFFFLLIPKSASAQGFCSCGTNSGFTECIVTVDNCDHANDFVPDEEICASYDAMSCGSALCVCISAGSASGGDINWGTLESASAPNFVGGTIGNIISNLLPYVLAIAGFLLLIFLVIGGFQLMTSSGDPKKASRAKGYITYAVVGFIVIFAAYWIIILIGRVLGIPSYRSPFPS